MLKVIQFPVLEDNYIFLIHNEISGETAVVDPSLADPVLEKLSEYGWKLDYIINTHHHWDHTDGNEKLKAATGAKIIAYAGDSHRISGIDIEVNDGDKIDICGEMAKVTYIPGHTLGHISYYFAESKILFCGDTMFVMGCGRLFEGTPQQMFDSFQKLSKLPKDTVVYCAHEYSEANAKFAITIEPENKELQNRFKEVCKLRAEGKSTVPTTVAKELATNPFMRAEAVEEFARVRKLKDEFKG